ncbi:hypothetical protein [Caballeronia sp. HLA56]
MKLAIGARKKILVRLAVFHQQRRKRLLSNDHAPQNQLFKLARLGSQRNRPIAIPVQVGVHGGQIVLGTNEGEAARAVDASMESITAR